MKEYILKQIPEDFVVDEISKIAYDLSGDYSVYELKRNGISLQKSLDKISAKFHIPMNRIGYAGIKDKIGLTTQAISLPRKIPDLIEHEFKITFKGYSKDPIYLGDLEGNKFTITIRGLDSSIGIEPGKKWMINYFDEQRFSTNNVEIGRSIIKDRLDIAIDQISKSSSNFSVMMQEHLESASRDYSTALKMMPKKILMFYVHAYQSMIWNAIVSEYMKRYGCNQIESTNGTLHVPVTPPKIVKVFMPGFGMEYENKEIEMMTDEIFRTEGINERSFISKKIPNISCESQDRKVIVEFDLESADLTGDELNPGKFKQIVSFTLPKGSYATMAIKQLMLQIN